MKNLSLSTRSISMLLSASVLALACANTVSAQDASPEQGAGLSLSRDEMPPLEEISQPEEAVLFEPEYQYTLEELGARYPFNLRGIDGSNSVPFNVRADEVVTRAEVDMTYSYSPALLSDLSHINVLINDEVAVSLPVPREEAGKSLQRTIPLPAHLITEFNRLRFQLIGHYTLECEDPLHSSLWTNISNKTQLKLDVQHVPLKNDLSILPLPFFDHRDSRRVTMPFVFANDKSTASLESAGMIASWFGAMAAYRGAEFPVQWNGAYPGKGNALILSLGAEAGAEASLPAISGPTLAITNNPNDPYGKFLWVMGRDAQELKLAAQALITGSATLSGQAATIQQLVQLKPRKPYDAPNWLRTDRPITFGELLPETELDVSGYNGAPVRLDLRLPPDLFGWREKPVPVDLRYRYTPQPGQVNSSLLISADEQFLKSFPLPSVDQIKDESWLKALTENEMLPVRAQMQIPLHRLMARSELEFLFMYDYIKEGQCRDIIIDNVRGRIDPDSTIDLSHYPHFMPLPDLAAFGESGFPFTRLADLSETAVLLSSQPAEQDISTYLTVMGRFGESTGYPATHVSVAQGASGLQQGDKDIVIIASGELSWLSDWTEYMPAMLVGQNKRFDLSDRVFKPSHWVTPDPRASQSPARVDLTYSSAGESAIFAGFESPVAKGRSVVLIASSEPQGQALAAKAMLDDEDFGNALQGSLAVVNDSGVHPLAAEYTYSIGKLGLWRSIEWNLVKYWPGVPSLWWLVPALLVLLLLLLIGLVWRRSRGRHAA